MKQLIIFLLGLNIAFGQAYLSQNTLQLQGIARDSDNQPLKNQNNIPLTFKLYYLQNNTQISIFETNDTVSTDGFGVFSYGLEIDSSHFNVISMQAVYIAVSSGSVLYSDEKISSSPYAIYARNGVPTGSIVAFRGEEDDLPSGWILCDGSSFPDDSFHEKLKSFLGATSVPDLRGLFLRGTGSYVNDNSKSGPSLNEVQDDAFVSHNHPINLTTSTNGNHAHQVTNTSWHDGNDGQEYLIGAKINGAGNQTTTTQSGGSFINVGGVMVPIPDRMSVSPEHNHSFDGDVGTAGSNDETRPANYGINYIIKI